MIATPLRFAAAVLALALAGCSSAPTHFYTLVPPSSGTPARRSAYLVEVLPVQIPAQMVVREGDDRVRLLEGEQWIAPLGDEIRTAFADRLGEDLGTHDVYGMPHAKDAPIYRVRLQVRRFDSVPGQYALIDATWSVQGPKGPVLDCRSEARESVAAGYAALVQGHQRALSRLADTVAGAVRALSSGGTPPSCPSP